MGFPDGSDGNVGGVCNFLSSVSSWTKIWNNWQTSVTAPCNFFLQISITAPCYSSVLFRKQRKINPRSVKVGQPKRREEKRSFQSNFGSSFYMISLLPLSLPCVNWVSQEGCLFYLRFSLRSSDLPLFYFCGLLPSLSFSQHHSGLLFPILTT